MYVRKHRNGYQVQVQVGVIRKSKILPDKKSAKQWGEKISTEIRNGMNLDKVKITLKQVIEDYKNQFTVHKKSKLKETKRWNVITRDYPDLVSKRIQDITPKDILTFKTDRGLDGHRTANYDLCLLNNLFKKCISVWLYPIQVNPVAVIEKFKIEKGRYRPIERHEYKMLLNSSDYIFQLGILILRNSGIRHNELHKLTFNDVDELRNKIIIRKAKNNKLREIPIKKWLIKKIQSTKVKGSIFIIPITQHALELRFKRVLKRFEFPTLQIHDFRRHYTQRLVDNKMDIFEIGKRTGHQSLQMISHYYGFGFR